MRRTLVLALVIAAGVACDRRPDSGTPRAPAGAPASTAATADTPLPGGATALRPGMNAVQTEMALLHQATLTAVTAVVNNTLSAVPPAFERVDAARTHTVAFLQTGKYRLPKNPERMAEFEQLDAAFHPQLAQLVQAAQSNDLPRATRQLGVVLDGCTECHARFRF